jgi:hypothetical protein
MILSTVIVNMIFYKGVNTHYSIIVSLIPPLFFGLILTLIIGFVTSRIKNTIIAKPQWNDSVLSLKRPLSLIHFFAYLLIILSLSTQFTQWNKDNDYNQLGIILGALGVGQIIGIWTIIKIKKYCW